MARPWKYDKLIDALEDDELYHTSRVIKNGDLHGLFEWSFDFEGRRLDSFEKRQVMKNARSSLAHFAVKHLPKKPDGYLEAEKPARALYPAHLGKTWKKYLAMSKE